MFVSIKPLHTFSNATWVANPAKIQQTMINTTGLSRAETPIAFIASIVDAYTHRGMSPSIALKRAQIAPSLLQKKNARVTALQMEWMSEAAMRELDDEALGWFGRRLPWGSYGMLVRASLTAPNLKVAMQRWCRHHELLTDSIGLRLQVEGNLAWLELHERPQTHDLGNAREFCVVSTLRNALGVASWLTDSRIALRQTQLHFAPPAHASSYRVLFEGEVQFMPHATHPISRIGFDSGYLQLPVRRDEQALQHMLERALPLTVRPYRRDRLLVEQVRHCLRTQAAQLRTADDIAHALNLSTRTLHRQLLEEGASLQALKDQIRQQLARDLLLRTHRSLQQIAQDIGFQNEKSFIRAFKGWTGSSPESFRQQPSQG